MLSRFNLDVKRMYYYDDQDKFNIEFTALSDHTNEKELLFDITETQILLVLKGPLKISLTNGSTSKVAILHNYQSISLIIGDKILISSNKDKLANFKFYKYTKTE
jgi:c-di-GMP-binding flagellar brake protein YcgR|tara:strand:- start:465 stop:779 length:315 start_codon:yes stop_codon:yes gene_type:complete